MAIRSILSLLLSGVLPLVYCDPQAALTGVSASVEFLATATNAAPELAAAATTAAASASACNYCYLVADVAGLVWYEGAFVNNVATAMVSVGQFSNGSQATRTSTIEDEGQFTFNPQAAASGGAALSAVPYDSTLNVNGAILTSPTAYNVFTAYSVTSAVLSNGVCSTVSGSRMVLPSAYSEILSSASGTVYLDQAGEQQFINYLGFTTCSGAGLSVVPTALVQVTSSTTTTTMTYSSGIPLAASTPTSASSTAGASSSGSNSTTTLPSASAPLIVVGNTTITPPVHPVNLPTLESNGQTLAIASTGLVPIPTLRNNFTSPTVIPFVSKASTWQRADLPIALGWTLGMFAVGLGMFYT